MLNTTILACLLILTGCLGLFDDDDVIDDADAQGDDTDSGSTTVENNYYNNTTASAGTSPTVQIMGGMDGGEWCCPTPIPLYHPDTGNLEGFSGYYTSIYYAMLDVDGTITSAGFDLDLDGTIDVSVSESRGVVNLTIPISEWVVWPEHESGDGDAMMTTVAFIAIDDDSLYTVEMYTLFTDPFEEEDDGPSMHVLTAGDHSDDVESNAGLMTLTFGNGADLDWALVQIEIIKDSVPYTCDNPGEAGGTCVISQHGGADQYMWEKGETIILTDTGGNFCDADCTLTVRVRYNNDVIMMANVYLI